MEKFLNFIKGIVLILLSPIVAALLFLLPPLTAILAKSGMRSYWEVTCGMFKS